MVFGGPYVPEIRITDVEVPTHTTADVGEIDIDATELHARLTVRSRAPEVLRSSTVPFRFPAAISCWWSPTTTSLPCAFGVAEGMPPNETVQSMPDPTVAV